MSNTYRYTVGNKSNLALPARASPEATPALDTRSSSRESTYCIAEGVLTLPAGTQFDRHPRI
eukprot:574419-Amorphochlora_amoeboformis.AAC.2